jgi:hypothetical protein
MISVLNIGVKGNYDAWSDWFFIKTYVFEVRDDCEPVLPLI